MAGRQKMASAVLNAIEACTAEPPGPKGIAAAFAFIQMRRNRLEFIQKMKEDYGPVSRLAIGHRRLILVSSKSGISQVLQHEANKYKKGMGFSEGAQFFQKGLITSEAEAWKEQRAALNPFFRNSNFFVWSKQIKEEIYGSLQTVWANSGNLPINLDHCIGDLTCNILGRTIIGAPFDSRRIRQSLLTVDAYVNKKMTSVSPILPLSYWRYKESIRYVHEVVRSIVRYNSSMPAKASLVSHILSSDKNNSLDVHDQTASFLLAGHDNTTSLISWTLLLLASNPQIQSEFRQNIKGNWSEAEVSPGLMEEEKYACALLFEVMRLFPPVWAIPRRAITDTKIDGYSIPNGSDILLFPYLVHRNPEYWIDPGKFDPSRFIADEGVNMMTILGRLQKERLFIPFGCGPRACIGFQHALAVSIIVIMAFIKHFYVSLPPKSLLPQPMPQLSLRPHPGASLLLTPIS